MEAVELKAIQEPIKQKYREDPAAAAVVLKARGVIELDRLVCEVQSHIGPVRAGLHAAAGGSGQEACSGEMLLEALVACAGVTLSAVATAMSIPLRSASIEATGEMDFRGTLGIDRSVPVGLTKVVLKFVLDTDASLEQQAKLVQLTERYCVILQTLKNAASVEAVLESVPSQRGG